MINQVQSSNQVNDLISSKSTNSYSINFDNTVITGISIGLPGSNRKIFDENNFHDILKSTNFIERIPEIELKKILDKNIMKIVKNKDGERTTVSINDINNITKLAGLRGKIDLVSDYGIPRAIVDTLDKTYELAIAAGLEALKNANIALEPTEINGEGPPTWHLPKAYQNSTGIIFASSFPVLDALTEEITNYLDNKIRMELIDELAELHESIREDLSDKAEKIFQEYIDNKLDSLPEYQFNRKLLFKLLVMGNAQLAQLIKAKGPNTTLNAACASTSQAVALAEDWIKLGRCERVIVVGADDPTSENLMQWIGTGFLILGASSIKDKVEEAALPFDKRRNGMILSMGAVGLIVESEKSALNRGTKPYCRILGSHIANSAFHGTGIDNNHISQELEGFISRMEKIYNFDRRKISEKMAYMSHETYTFANGGSAKAEIDALKFVFGQQLENIIISNTKGFTGHPMGVGFEEAVAAYALRNNVLPSIANFKETDPILGKLRFPLLNDDFDYILRFAAGFGSQIVYLLLQKMV